MIIVMMLVGAFAVYLLLQNIYDRLWNKNLTTSIRFSSAHAVAGDTVELIESVANIKMLPLPYIHVKFQIDRSLKFTDSSENAQVSDKVYRNDIFSLLMYQRVTRRIPVVCSRRGVYRIGSLEIVSTGLFMNEVLVANVGARAEITVYPAAADVHLLETVFSKAMGDVEKNKYLYEDPFVFRGIRDYEPHDTMNAINWKASARMGHLMVNQYNETISQEVCILLNLEPEGMLVYDMLSEASISIAAGLAQMFIEQGISVSMISNGRDIATGAEVRIEAGGGYSHINGINTLLARIDLSMEMASFASLLPALEEERRSSTQIMYIMISQNRREDLQRRFEQLTEYARFVRPASEPVWIVPYHSGMDTALDYCSAQAVAWEVERYAG